MPPRPHPHLQQRQELRWVPLISPSHRHSSINIPSKSLGVRHETTRVLDCQMLSVVRTNVEYFSTSSSGNEGKCSRVRDQESNFPVDSWVIFTLAGLNYLTPFHIFELHFLSINAFIQSLHISTCQNYAY